MISRAIANEGIPLKIQTQYTDNDYWEREHPDTDDLRCINVAGWLIRINGVKFPRPDVWDDGRLDWTYRYTPKDTAEGKMIAVEKAVREYEKN